MKLSKRDIILMAITSGISIAGVIYNQPLLKYISEYFGVGRDKVGLVSTLTQIGYGLGLLFIVPLGDIVEKKALLIRMLRISTLALGIIILAPKFYILLLGCFMLGFSSMVTQILVPFAASMVKVEERGAVIGTIISGLLVGIISGRLISGFLGARLSFKAPYILSIVLIIGITTVLKRCLPESKVESKAKYTQIMGSLWGIIAENKVIRASAIIGGLIFGSFQLFWTSIAFHLSAQYGFGSEYAGLMSLGGILGVFMVPKMGRFCDIKSPNFGISIATITAFISFGLLWIFGEIFWALFLSVAALDFGVNSTQVTVQARLNKIDSPKRNRFNSIFMSVFFFGGSIGSFLGAYIYSRFGWSGICITGMMFSATAIAVHALSFKNGLNEAE